MTELLQTVLAFAASFAACYPLGKLAGRYRRRRLAR